MDFTITAEERETLLRDARETIAAKFEDRKPCYTRSLELSRTLEEGNSALLKPCGAFVTLREAGNLRGCIGHMRAELPLEETVHTMALEAAFGDPRFPPLSPGELAQVSIEISALSPMEICANPRGVKVGVHGLYLSCQGRTGVLLPQVPVEQGWDLDEYLDYICIKAGLPAHSYKVPGARLFTFTAIVFSEE